MRRVSRRVVVPLQSTAGRRRPGPRLHCNSTYPSLTSSSRVWGHGFRMASLRTLGWTRTSLGCASYVPALRYGNLQAGRPNIREQNMWWPKAECRGPRLRCGRVDVAACSGCQSTLLPRGVSVYSRQAVWPRRVARWCGGWILGSRPMPQNEFRPSMVRTRADWARTFAANYR